MSSEVRSGTLRTFKVSPELLPRLLKTQLYIPADRERPSFLCQALSACLEIESRIVCTGHIFRPDRKGNKIFCGRYFCIQQSVIRLRNLVVFFPQDASRPGSSIEGGEKRFSPPSIEEVDSYIREKGYTVDAERFVNFYESKGWYVGKNKMKNWRAAVATWQKEDNKRNGINQQRSCDKRRGTEATATRPEDYEGKF